MAIQQEQERKMAQQHLLESLNNIEGHVGEFWDQLGTLDHLFINMRKNNLTNV